MSITLTYRFGYATEQDRSRWDQLQVDLDQLAAGREGLTAARTYYVATNGSDSNAGLTAGAAFATIQKAIDAVAALDVSTFGATIQVADGTYTQELELKDFVGTGTVTLQGNTTTPANCVISVANPVIANISKKGNSNWTVAGFKLVSTGTQGQHISVTRGVLTLGNKMEIGAVPSGFVQLATSNGGILALSGDYTISSGAGIHMLADWSNIQVVSNVALTVTLTGTPAFSFAFAVCRDAGFIAPHGLVFSGSATGTRYFVTTNAIINTFGGGAAFFPGNAAGSATLGGLYG